MTSFIRHFGALLSPSSGEQTGEPSDGHAMRTSLDIRRILRQEAPGRRIVTVEVNDTRAERAPQPEAIKVIPAGLTAFGG